MYVRAHCNVHFILAIMNHRDKTRVLCLEQMSDTRRLQIIKAQSLSVCFI